MGENLAATCVDMAWHMLASKDIPTVEKAAEFETEALRQVGLLDAQIPPRYFTSYFNHVWGGGYAAGYYSYLWTEVLAVNIADVFAQRGALKPETGQEMRDKILSRGNTGDLMRMFTDFTGMAQPDASSLLKARGLWPVKTALIFQQYISLILNILLFGLFVLAIDFQEVNSLFHL